MEARKGSPLRGDILKATSISKQAPFSNILSRNIIVRSAFKDAAIRPITASEPELKRLMDMKTRFVLLISGKSYRPYSSLNYLWVSAINLVQRFYINKGR